ncbi:hypothetical protein DL95DRAFT_388749 [Leptodontidium sp. 2 PMI_412]|nr:hypothetical protein BKA61DRAFT_613652 [Leptodontidium sp. MPI-SDFR-AT-0119]KAH9215438.1 hypothetical protein DL95DRAFT_388749 [Leptodontidium sp. 2 PMI_412]
MFLSQSPGPEGPELIRIPPEKNEFDFVVTERPKYIPNFGPPLAPISIMPSHDKDGLIVASFDVNHHPRYVVSWEHAPYLRMSVAPENVLNYVSRRTFEQFEYQETLRREGRLGNGKSSKGAKNISDTRDDSKPKEKGKPGRKRKHVLVEADDDNSAPESSRPKVMVGPTSRVARKSIEEPEPVLISPQRPTLSSPSKQRGLADMVESEESEEEEEELPTDIAIEAQLTSTMQSHPRSRLNNNVFQSPSPEPSSVSKGKQKAFSPTPRDTRSSSRQYRGSLSRSASVSTSTNEAKRQRRSARNDSVATTSSLEAGKIYEALERKESRSKTPSKKSAPFEQYSSIAKNKKEAASSSRKAHAPDVGDEEEELGEEEYEVEAILDETQISVGKKGKHVVTYYLIRWVGNWPLSWEPAENVGQESIDEYENKKMMGLIVVGEAGAAFDTALEAEAEARERESKDKRKRRNGGDGAGDESEENLDNFTRSTAIKYKAPTQGQVIDDDDGSEYES